MDFYASVRNNSERAYRPCAQFPPVVPAGDTLVQYQNQSVHSLAL